AKARPDEVKCPDLEVNQLVKITDVTDRIAAAVAGKSDADANAARKAEMSRIEKACATSDAVRCDVVSLYEGGVYDLYEYRRYQDVRLVFAPELAIAFFGGDPDNFNFPRYALDSAFVRVYEGDKPAATPNFFAWSEAGTKAGDLTFVTGHPGRTSRLKTVAELASFRNKALLRRLLWLSELRGALAEYGHRGAEQARHSRTWLFYVENGL
ncbi:MAG: S46 family peptidase, partial [Myxococcales bacterium]|nr:S46 family peptidase [Myxococcales bacterium]